LTGSPARASVALFAEFFDLQLPALFKAQDDQAGVVPRRPNEAGTRRVIPAHDLVLLGGE
jgi:hypothetical protein